MAAPRALLLACLAAALAAGALAQEACPDHRSYKGCKSCTTIPTTRRSTELVCDACEEGFTIADRGSRRAHCECAPGYAGRGNHGVCEPCPEGTHIALGGPVDLSQCIRCPAGTVLSRDGKSCACPAGFYLASARNERGVADVSCVLCGGRTSYIAGHGHTSRSCSTCPSGQVANKAHTDCVSPLDLEAAPAPAIPGLGIQVNELGQVFKDARARSESLMVQQADSLEQRLSTTLDPLQRMASRISGFVSGDEPLPQLPRLQDRLQDLAKGMPELPKLGELSLRRPKPAGADEDEDEPAPSTSRAAPAAVATEQGPAKEAEEAGGLADKLESAKLAEAPAEEAKQPEAAEHPEAAAPAKEEEPKHAEQAAAAAPEAEEPQQPEHSSSAPWELDFEVPDEQAPAPAATSAPAAPAAPFDGPSLEELRKLSLRDLARVNASELAHYNLTDLATLPQLNLTKLSTLPNFNLTDLQRLTPEDLAAHNLTDLLKISTLNFTNADTLSRIGASVNKVLQRVSDQLGTSVPRLPDPMYAAGLKLDPEVLREAGLPDAKTVPELFVNLMSDRMGDVLEGGWDR